MKERLKGAMAFGGRDAPSIWRERLLPPGCIAQKRAALDRDANDSDDGR
jgi:hypothetical protein